MEDFIKAMDLGQIVTLYLTSLFICVYVAVKITYDMMKRHEEETVREIEADNNSLLDRVMSLEKDDEVEYFMFADDACRAIVVENFPDNKEIYLHLFIPETGDPSEVLETKKMFSYSNPEEMYINFRNIKVTKAEKP